MLISILGNSRVARVLCFLKKEEKGGEGVGDGGQEAPVSEERVLSDKCRRQEIAMVIEALPCVRGRTPTKEP